MRQAIFKVTLTKTSTSLIEVDYRTKDGTATAPSDYTPVSGTLSFLPGQRVKNIVVQVRDEIASSLKEQFTLELSAPRNCQLGRNTGIMVFNTGPEPYKNGPLIKNGLLTNSYHRETGRGGYFHEYSGTSEGQSIAIEGAFLAYAALKDGTPEEQTAAAWYKLIGQKMLDAMGDGSATGPMLRQKIPDDVNTITLLHWLFAARGDIPQQGVNYSFEAAPVGGKILIPQYVNGTHKGGPDLYRIFQIFPATSQLLYTSPYSPSYDKENPTDDTSIRIDLENPGEAGSAHWKLVDKTVELTLPSDIPSDVPRWVVVYGYNNAGTIKQGQAEEAYPYWTTIEPSYSACAPDTFRWFDYAMSIAALYDDRSGKAADWTKLRNALRRTAVRGQNITDLREIIKPMPNFPAIPPNGEPSGMFCYSSNPGAGTPPDDVISAGGNVDWVGYKYWRREGGSGKASPTLDELQHWEPKDASTPRAQLPDSKLLNGSLVATVPTGGPNQYTAYEYQIGRGINDSWRSATPYQDPDQFLLVVTRGIKGYWEIQDNTNINDQTPMPTMRKQYFISLTKAYNPEKRYVANACATYRLGFKEYGSSKKRRAILHTLFFYRINSFNTDGQPDPAANDTNNVNYSKAKFFNQSQLSDLTGDPDLCFELIPIEAFQKSTLRYSSLPYEIFDGEPLVIHPTKYDYVFPEVVAQNLRVIRLFGDDDTSRVVSRREVPYYTWTPYPVPKARADEVLPRDAVIENFGMLWMPGREGSTQDGGILFMRLVSGPSKQWVLDNLHKAIKGSAMPFFPGAMPFAINANVANQSFVGFNGNPFHGYQLPDYWWFLQADAEAVHADITVADLPTAALSGAIEYVISATTSGGVTKQKHALLAEQQLIFLKRAQEKWAADAGFSGPFAHTFVLNTPARQTIGNPTPHTWVYTNDDPNTRWVGYQVRVVESISKLAWLARNDASWDTCVTLSVNMAIAWLTRLNVDWPDLNGKDYADPVLGTVKIYGMPTDYDNPTGKGISTAYEEPHAASLVLRACIWLLESGKLSAGQVTLVQTILKRCWDYIEMRWRTGEDDTMRYTWASRNSVTQEQYYGFWHFEIITTICHLLEHPTTIPTSATAAQLRERLVLTQSWTKAKTE